MDRELSATKTKDQEIILLFGEDADPNPLDARGRTPLHDFAMGKGVRLMTLEYIHGAKEMIAILSKNGARFDIKDDDGRTPLDLALNHAPALLIEEFIKLSLSENPELAKPSFTESQLELSNFWDTCKQEASAQLKTNLQASTSGATSRAAFFKPVAANAPTYDDKKSDDVQRHTR